MKNLYNKYFDYLDIENEGYRRILIVVIILLIPIIFIELTKKYPSPDDLFKVLYVLISPPIYSIIGIGVIIKILNWIKEGFNPK